MKSNKPDISLIRKYLNGELDTKAMYELERQAQDDPMLMDVIMGMEGDHQETDEASLSSIDELIRKRVQQPAKTTRIFERRSWAIAASLIFALMAAFWMFRSPDSPSVKQQQVQVKQAAPAEEKAVPVENKPSEISVKETQMAKTIRKTIKPEMAKISAKQTAPPAPFAQSPVKAVVDSAAIARAAALNQYADVTITKHLNNATAKQQDNSSDKQLNEVVVVGYAVTRKKEVAAATTNLNTSPAAVLQGKVSGVEINNDQSLSEVVVVKKGPEASAEPKPVQGWKAYKKYLKENAILMDGTSGSVVVAFMINRQGSPDKLRIVKGLTDEINRKAILLIGNGPRWIAGTDHPEKEITVRIRFH